MWRLRDDDAGVAAWNALTAAGWALVLEKANPTWGWWRGVCEGT
jgi:hypothetical protein